jgi:predicted nucleic acid-binding protein
VARKAVIVVIPDVCVYEVRRELIRLEATAQLKRLGGLRKAPRQARVSPAAWAKAAEFWALVRRQGIPTDTPDALDGDAILAAVAVTLGQRRDTVTIATTNVGHLNRFPGVEAREWQNVI